MLQKPNLFLIKIHIVVQVLVLGTPSEPPMELLRINSPALVAEVVNVTSKCNGVTRYRSSPVLRVITMKSDCLALCLRLLLGDIGFVYPVMSMVVVGHSLPILRQRRWSLVESDI